MFLIIDCVYKMREYIVWFDELDSETLVFYFDCCLNYRLI